MLNYPGIFKVEDFLVEPKELFGEFEKYSHDHNFINFIKDKSDWTGLCVFDGDGRRTGNKKNLLKEFPALKGLTKKIGIKNIHTVWFLNLTSGARLHSHRDTFGNLLFGMMRVHIPIKSNPSCTLTIQNKDIFLPLGEVWSLDTSALHGAQNNSKEDRIHIVIDVKKSKETKKFFPELNLVTWLHIINFSCFVLPIKMLRGLLTQPKSLVRKVFKKQFDS